MVQYAVTPAMASMAGTSSLATMQVRSMSWKKAPGSLAIGLKQRMMRRAMICSVHRPPGHSMRKTRVPAISPKEQRYKTIFGRWANAPAIVPTIAET